MSSQLESIGRTPLVELTHLRETGSAHVFVKLESANPTGSMKDRMAASMIDGAERRGSLKRGGRVVDYTGGSTGSSLAMVCAAKGYRAHFVSSDAFAEEKLATMRVRSDGRDHPERESKGDARIDPSCAITRR